MCSCAHRIKYNEQSADMLSTEYPTPVSNYTSVWHDMVYTCGYGSRIPVVVEVSHVSRVDSFMTQKCRRRSHYKCRRAARDDRQTRVNLGGSRPLKCPVSLKGANNALVSLRCGGDDDPPTVSRACHNDNDDMNIHNSRKGLTPSGVASTEWWWRLISVKREQSKPNVHDGSRRSWQILRVKIGNQSLSDRRWIWNRKHDASIKYNN